MKKIFTLFTLLLCVVSSAWADAETIGITNTTTTTSKQATTETLTGSGNDVTVAKLALSSSTQALSVYSTGDKAMNDGSSTSVYSTHAYKWNKNTGTSINLTDYPSEYVGFSFTIASGKTFSVSGLNAKLAGSANFVFRIVIEKSDGTVLYSSTDKTINRTSDNELTVTNITANNVQNLKEGTYNVKAHLAFNSTGKYLVFTKLHLTGTVGTASADPESPVITTDLNSEYTAYVGDELSLSISASHVDGYQWYENTSASNTGGTAIEGATSATYTYTPADADFGVTKYFYCVATNSEATGIKTAVSKVAAVIVDKQTKIGLQQINDGVVTGDYKGTLASATYKTVNHLVVSEAHGSLCDVNQSGRKTTGPDGDYYATNCFKKSKDNNSGDAKWMANEWVGYKITVASGYAMSLSNLKATLWDANSDATYAWRVIVENSSGTALYTSAEKSSSKSSIDILSVNSPTGLSTLPEGTYTVKLQVYQGGGNKYFTVPYLTFDAEVVEHAVTKYTVTTSINDDAMGSVTETTEFIEGTDAVVTATPNVGNKFLKWVIDEGTADEAESTDNPYTFTSISAAHTAKAYFGTSKKVTYNILENVKGTRTDIFTTEYADDNDKFTIPAVNLYLSSDNKTLTGWTDASNNNYTPGQEITLTDDIVLSPVFTDNDGETFAATLEANKSDFSTTWSLSSSVSSFNVEQKTAFYVQQAEINGETVDVPMAIDATAGKVNNQGRTDQWAQTNGGTKFTIPVVNGSIITMVGCNAFKTEAWEEGNVTKQPTKFNGNMLTSDNLSSDSKTATYTYQGTTGTLVIEVGADIKYTSTITVTYPSLYTAAPTIAAGAFSFENKYYPVTITGAAGTTKIETSTDDGATWEEQTLTDLACTVNVTAGQTLKARATAEGKEPSETVSFTNDFDATKKYVAWVYGTDGNYTQYNPATDKMVIALKEDYNVVAVGSVNTQSPSNDLNNADLIVCSEAMTGNKTFSNGMKVFAGVTPMIGLKAYNYTKGRWSWGTPENPSSTAQSFIPKSKLYKVLKNVAYETDGSIKLATATSGNVIQTVEFGTTDCTAPEGNVIMGTLDNNDAKAVMYASNKYFGLGLSCDCRETYTDNAITIIKNAAAMLIAGELMILEPSDPVAEGDVVTLTTTATMAGWRAFYDADNSYTVDENTKVYVAKNENEGKVTLTEYAAGVPAGTPVILKTSAEAETDGTFKMTLTKTTETITPTYTGESLLKVTPLDGNVYRLGSKSGEVGFFPFNATGAAAGIVVLNVDSSNAGARGLGITFDDETTAIHNVKDNMDVNKNVYDLQGRSVAKPTKGLYIVNGKKVVIK